MTGLWMSAAGTNLKQDLTPYTHRRRMTKLNAPIFLIRDTLRRGSLGLLLIMVWLGMTPAVLASTGVDNGLEYEIKGAFLFKFGAFVEWPAGTFATPSAPLIIGILGDDPFGPKLDQIVQGHTIDGRPVVIWRAQQIGALKDVHILFIGQSERGRIGAILPSLQGKMLIVAEFAHPAIIINFVTENNKVRFDVNLDQAERIGLKLSSKLLSVARVVKGK